MLILLAAHFYGREVGILAASLRLCRYFVCLRPICQIQGMPFTRKSDDRLPSVQKALRGSWRRGGGDSQFQTMRDISNKYNQLRLYFFIWPALRTDGIHRQPNPERCDIHGTSGCCARKRQKGSCRFTFLDSDRFVDPLDISHKMAMPQMKRDYYI